MDAAPINSDPMLYLLEDVATLWKLQKQSKTWCFKRLELCFPMFSHFFVRIPFCSGGSKKNPWTMAFWCRCRFKAINMLRSSEHKIVKACGRSVCTRMNKVMRGWVWNTFLSSLSPNSKCIGIRGIGHFHIYRCSCSILLMDAGTFYCQYQKVNHMCLLFESRFFWWDLPFSWLKSFGWLKWHGETIIMFNPRNLWSASNFSDKTIQIPIAGFKHQKKRQCSGCWQVFVAWSPGKPAFYMRIMQKIMLMFGHNKKACCWS